MSAPRHNLGTKRSTWRVVAFLGIAAALAIVACLPDLQPRPAPSPDASIALPLSSCGDGLIETLDDGGDAGESCDPGDAQAAGCESCTFACSSGRVDDVGHCYFLADPQTSYVEATGACRRANAHLVTLGSAREATFAASVVGGADFWVDLVVAPDVAGSPYGTFGRNEPGWPRGGSACPGCFALGADDAGRFPVHPDELRTDGGERSCLVEKDGGWLQARCEGVVDAGYATLCEREPVGQRAFFCGGPYCTTLPSTAGRKRYVFGSPTTADEARELCETYPGGRLVVLESPDERAELVREISARFPDDREPVTVWIGLARVDGGPWTWDDGMDERAWPPVWGAGEPRPSGDRAFLKIDRSRLDTQLAFNDGDPRTPRLVACQRPIPE